MNVTDPRAAACPTGYACLACRTPAPACDMPDGCGAAPGQSCEPGCPSLAADGNELAVSVASTVVGLICLTRCTACTADGRWPRLAADAVRRMAVEHGDHFDVRTAW